MTSGGRYQIFPVMSITTLNHDQDDSQDLDNITATDVTDPSAPIETICTRNWVNAMTTGLHAPNVTVGTTGQSAADPGHLWHG